MTAPFGVRRWVVAAAVVAATLQFAAAGHAALAVERPGPQVSTSVTTTHDTDGDGLADDVERDTYGTDPTNADTDGDGLDDGTEVHRYGTDSTNADTDGDGFADGTEVAAGTDPARQNERLTGRSAARGVGSGFDAAVRAAETGEKWAYVLGALSVCLVGALAWGALRWYRRYTSPVVVRLE